MAVFIKASAKPAGLGLMHYAITVSVEKRWCVNREGFSQNEIKLWVSQI
jgi:hypothetical protein